MSDFGESSFPIFSCVICEDLINMRRFISTEYAPKHTRRSVHLERTFFDSCIRLYRYRATLGSFIFTVTVREFVSLVKIRDPVLYGEFHLSSSSLAMKWIRMSWSPLFLCTSAYPLPRRFKGNSGDLLLDAYLKVPLLSHTLNQGRYICSILCKSFALMFMSRNKIFPLSRCRKCMYAKQMCPSPPTPPPPLYPCHFYLSPDSHVTKVGFAIVFLCIIYFRHL